MILRLVILLAFTGFLKSLIAAPPTTPPAATARVQTKGASAETAGSFGAAAPTSPPTPSPVEASIALQRAAVAKQTNSLSGGGNGSGTADVFFSVPWSSPATIPIPAIVPQCQALSEEEITTLATDAAKVQDLKPELVRAVIRRESDSYPCAISEKGAVGLMQLMPDVAAQLGVDPLDPAANVQAGSKYLKQLMAKYKGDLKLSLAAYNAGPKTVDANNKVPDIPETTAYVDAILKDLNINGAPKP